MKGIEVLFILFYTERVCYKENHHLMKINCFLFGRSSNDDYLCDVKSDGNANN